MITVERLRELLHYCLATGIFTWLKKSSPSSRVRIGAEAGYITSHGYRHIVVDGVTYKAHRLAWLTGEWPEDQMDHKNRDRSDNRFCNLRECSNGQNKVNSLSAGRLKWARRSRNKWCAQVWAYQERYLGTFDAPQEAALVAATVAYGVHGEFARPHWRDLLGDMRGVTTG